MVVNKFQQPHNYNLSLISNSIAVRVPVLMNFVANMKKVVPSYVDFANVIV